MVSSGEEGLRPKQTKALTLSTLALAACFAVWTIFSIIGIQLQQELNLNETQFGLLLGTPILTGSLSRFFLGIWADQFGGRIVFVVVMTLAAMATFLLSYADSYIMALLASLGIGLAGGSFTVGVAYVSRWYSPEKQGTALGIFGMGNVGTGITMFIAPFVLVAFGWQTVARSWAAALIAMTVIFWLMTEDDPDFQRRKQDSKNRKSFIEQLEPLRNLQVWRFSLYYFYVFGGFVALSLWLPRYLIGVYEVDIKTAGILASCFAIPASLFRAYGGHLSDKYGARTIMYMTFSISILCTFMLSYPKTDYIIHGIEGPIYISTSVGLVPFVMLIFVLGVFMALGMAAVFKHIPTYYPKHVGAVGGLVGMIGGLGGFILPIFFGVMNDLTGIWTSHFMLMFGIATVSIVWMHIAIRQMEIAAQPQPMPELPEFPEMLEIHDPKKHPAAVSRTLTDWRPEDEGFWETAGRRIAQRNLWISIPCLLLAFSVWLIWSVVVVRLPSVGFDYTTNQLFWLAAVPGLSGATLRVFYAFMVPIMGGRFWTTLSTASLLIPAFGIGYAVQNQDTSYVVLLILALLCGLGGGNFASSMANISFFFPGKEKGNALSLKAGLGKLGVGVMQLVVPLVVTLGVFGAIGGEPQTTEGGDSLWLQNAGFIWVPFLVIATFTAWFGMNDIASVRISIREQAVILGRKHSWLMCWLYTGTFGSFIGYSAGFPLLSQTQFPDVDALKLAFLGPLASALAWISTGRISDKYGNARVTFWVFVSMAVALSGVLYFLAIKDQPDAYWGFFIMFMLLFVVTGVGNAASFQMIPAIMLQDIPRLAPGLSQAEQRRQAEKESAAIIGFTSAIAAYGAFFIPKALGTSITLTGSPEAALLWFLGFYASCIFLTWYFYSRRGGLLYRVEYVQAPDTRPAV